MTTWAMSLKVPPPLAGGLDDQEETVMAGLRPFLESLPDRPSTRAGNVLAFDVLSAEGFRPANSYLLLLTVDNPADKKLARIAEEIVAVLPEGSSASVLGEFKSVARSSAQKAHA